MENQTLSPQSNKLLEMCAGVIEGREESDNLYNLLEEMYEGLEKARGEFIEQIEKLDEQYKEKILPEADLVVNSFDNYQDALDQISAYFQSSNKNDIQKGMEMIVESTEELLNSLTAYEAKSLQVGPTSFPILNMLILLSDGFKNGTVTEEDFLFMINNSGMFFQKMVEEAEGYKGTEGREAIEILKEGYYKFLEGLEKLDDGVGTKNFLLFDDALKIIEASQEIIKVGYTKYNEEMFLSGPTESPMTNLLISTIKGVKEGTFPKELLAENLEKYQEHMNSIRTDFESASGIPLDEQIEDEIERTLDALDISDDACEEIKQFIKSGNLQLLDAAVDKLVKATEMLKKTSEVFDEITEREGKIACVHCGAFNEPTNNNCTSCKAVLTKIPGQDASTFAVGEGGEIQAEGSTEFVMTENLYTLLEGAEKVINGRGSFDEFIPVLDWMEDLLNSTYDESKSIPSINLDQLADSTSPSLQHYRKIASDTVGLLQFGIDEFLEAIHEMRQFGVDGDMMHFRKGIDGVIEATKKLQYVQKISESSYEPAAKGSYGDVPTSSDEEYDEEVDEDMDEDDEDEADEDEESESDEEDEEDEEEGDGDDDDEDKSYMPISDSYK
jgi:hypothetical protein